jgi:hypothetical protein
MTKSFTNCPQLNCENTMIKTNAWRTFLRHLLLCTFFSKLGVNFRMSCSLNLVVQFLFLREVALNLGTNILHGVWIEQNCVFSFFWCAKSCTMITLCSSLHSQEIVSNSFFYIFLPYQNWVCMFACHVSWIKIVQIFLFLGFKKVFLNITGVDHGTCWKMWKCIMASISIVEQILVVCYKIA